MDEQAIERIVLRMNNLKLRVELGLCNDWLGVWNHIDAMCEPEYNTTVLSWQAQLAVILAKKGVVLEP